MLIISRQNNLIHYSYRAPPAMKQQSYDICLPPIPRVNRRSIHDVSIDKWYIVHKNDVDQIIDTLIDTFYKFIETSSRYNIYFNEEEFRDHMIRTLYNSSQNKNKFLI